MNQVPTLPTPEQLLKGTFEVVVPDKKQGEKDTRRNLRRVFVVRSLFKRGAIGKAELLAATEFERLFNVAQLEGLRAASIIEKVDGSRSDTITHTAACARQRVNEAITYLGGVKAPAASIVWHVCGLGLGMSTWAESTPTSLSRSEGSGVLVVALDNLATFFERH